MERSRHNGPALVAKVGRRRSLRLHDAEDLRDSRLNVGEGGNRYIRCEERVGTGRMNSMSGAGTGHPDNERDLRNRKDQRGDFCPAEEVERQSMRRASRRRFVCERRHLIRRAGEEGLPDSQIGGLGCKMDPRLEAGVACLGNFEGTGSTIVEVGLRRRRM